MDKDETEDSKKAREKIVFNLLLILIPIASLCFVIVEHYEMNGGTFQAIINGKEVTTSENRTILVYLDKDSADISQIDVCPKITNPSLFNLQRVMLTYKFKSNSANISYSNHYTVDELSDGDILKNNDKTSCGGDTLPRPFRCFIMKNNGQATISLQAIYKGKKRFSHQSIIYSKKIFDENESNRQRAIFNDAKGFFDLNKNTKKIDLYIFNNDSVCFFENQTADSVSRKDSINDGRTKVYWSLPTTELSSETEIKGVGYMPWYMYIVGGLLGIIFIFGALVSMASYCLVVYKDSIKPTKAIFKFLYESICEALTALSTIAIVVSSCISFVSLYFFMRVFFTETSGIYWPWLAWIYGMFITFINTRVMAETLFENPNKQRSIYIAILITLIFSIVLYIILF